MTHWTDLRLRRIHQRLEALEAALAQQAEPVREMPSNTRYTVAVEGQALTYWDSVHDAITHAQRAVYAGVDATTRAIDDLRAGRLAEWSYGFSAVRIYRAKQIKSEIKTFTTCDVEKNTPPSEQGEAHD